MKTTNTKPQRKLIYFDQAAYTTVIKSLPAVIKQVIELKEAYMKLEVGEFSDEIFKEIITLGIEPLHKRYNEGLNTSLSALGSINSQIRANLLINTETSFKGLEITFNALTRIAGQILIGLPLPLTIISIIDGFPVVIETDLEKIREEFCRTYIETPIEHEIYNKLKNMADAYNEMLKTFETTGYKQFFEMGYLEQIFSEHPLTKFIDVKHDAVGNIFNFQHYYQLARPWLKTA